VGGGCKVVGGGGGGGGEETCSLVEKLPSGWRQGDCKCQAATMSLSDFKNIPWLLQAFVANLTP